MTRQRWIDLLLVAGLAGAMVVELVVRNDERTSVSLWSVLACLTATLPTVLRHRHPVAALVACMVLVYAVLAVVDVHNTIPFSSMLCGYSVALVASRKQVATVTALLVPAVVAAIIVFSPSHAVQPAEQLKNLAFVCFPLVAGRAVRNRRDYESALLDRAETAERTSADEAARRVGEERLRIARDLHDVVAHAMVAINVQAGVGLHLVDREPERARDALRDIQAASGEALTDLRSTLGVLRAGDAPVQPALGLEDLDDLVMGVRSAGVGVALDVDPAALTAPSTVAASAYRIVQEALTNVVRHAGADTRVRVAREHADLVVEVVDDGRGVPPPAPAGTGSGIRGMRERASAVGGSLEAGPYARGWRVRAVLPLAPVEVRQ